MDVFFETERVLARKLEPGHWGQSPVSAFFFDGKHRYLILLLILCKNNLDLRKAEYAEPDYIRYFPIYLCC